MKTVLITGGSSGIGLELSKYFAQDDYQLLWVALADSELESAKANLQAQFPNTIIHTLALDLSIADAPEQVYNWVQMNQWQIDVLVNNAGIGSYGFLSETNLEVELKMIHLNVLAVYRMTRLFLKDMQNRNAGTIINISSVSSLQAIPKMNTYASTKAFVKHFTLGLMEELKMMQSSVRMMLVYPAAIPNTKFRAAAKMERVKTFQGLAYVTVEEVAKDIWNGFKKGKPIVVSGWKMRWIYAVQNYFPNWLLRFLIWREVEEE